MQRTSARFRAPTTRAPVVRVGLLALILIVTSIAGYLLGWFDYQHMLEHVERLRRSHSVAQFVIGFIVAFGMGTAVGVPGLPFTVAAGALFGTLLGTVLSWVGGMLGAAAGYWIARTVGHDVVVRWLRRFRQVDAAVTDSQHFAGMLRLRLIPVLSLGTVNFVGGLARVPFGRYVGATAIGILPATIIYAYFADSLVERVGHGHTDAMRSLIIASVLLILLSLAPKLLARKESRDDGSSRDLAVTSDRCVRSG